MKSRTMKTNCSGKTINRFDLRFDAGLTFCKFDKLFNLMSTVTTVAAVIVLYITTLHDSVASDFDVEHRDDLSIDACTTAKMARHEQCLAEYSKRSGVVKPQKGARCSFAACERYHCGQVSDMTLPSSDDENNDDVIKGMPADVQIPVVTLTNSAKYAYAVYSYDAKEYQGEFRKDKSGLVVPRNAEIIKATSGTNTEIAAYFDSKSGDIYIAYRGTDYNSSADWQSNRSMGASEILSPSGLPTGAWAADLAVAKSFTDDVIRAAKARYPTAHLYLVGHSRGGSFAQLEGARTGLTTYTFNAPGVGRSVHAVSTNSNVNNIYNFSRKGDAVSELSRPAGHSIEFESPGDSWRVVDAGGNARSGMTAVYGTRSQNVYRHLENSDVKNASKALVDPELISHDMKTFYTDIVGGMYNRGRYVSSP